MVAEGGEISSGAPAARWRHRRRQERRVATLRVDVARAPGAARRLALPLGRGGRAAIVIGLVTLVSALLVAPAPTYDPWAWLLWGREVASLSLSTAEGPAFKPLPVAVCAVLSLLGPAAPVAWVLVARAGARRRAVLGRLPGGRRARARSAVALTRRVPRLRRERRRDRAGRRRSRCRRCSRGATAAHARRSLWGAACALLRVEAWPFLALAGVVVWRRQPGAAAVARRLRGGRAGAVVRPRVARLGRPAALGRTRARARTPASPRRPRSRHSPRCARRPRCRCGRCGSARVFPPARAAAAPAGRAGVDRARRRDGAGRVLRRAALLAPGRRVRRDRGRRRALLALARRQAASLAAIALALVVAAVPKLADAAGPPARPGLPVGARRRPASGRSGRRRPRRAARLRPPVRRRPARPAARLPPRRREAPRRRSSRARRAPSSGPALRRRRAASSPRPRGFSEGARRGVDGAGVRCA